MAKRLREESISSKLEDGTSEQSSEPKSRSQSVDSSVHNPKYASLEEGKKTRSTMRCLLPPHKPLGFSNYTEYESHYQQSHTNRCTECKKNFPTGHFLELHIAENHDPIIATQRDAEEKTYACFVEGCEKVCIDWKKRRSHLVDKHLYPKNYDFLVVNNGIDGRRSMLRPGIDAQGHRESSRERDRRTSSASQVAAAATGSASVDEQRIGASGDQIEETSPILDTTESRVVPPPAANAGVDELTSSMSSLKMVPRTVTFGKRRGRWGFAKS